MKKKTIINSRIKKVRNTFDLTQEKFAERLNISRSTIAAIENNTNNPSDQLIANICNQFGINKDWIETGKGPMRKPLEEIIRKDISNFSKEEARQALINILTEIEEEEMDNKYEKSEFIKVLNLLKKKYQNANRDTQGWITVEIKRTFLNKNN